MTVSAPSSITNSPVLLMVLVISIGFNILAGAQAVTTLLPDQRVDSLVTQFIDAKQVQEIGRVVAGGLEELLDEEKMNKRRRKRKRKIKKSEGQRVEEEELYSYSDLPRLF